MKLKIQFKKLLSTLLIVQILLINLAPVSARAEEVASSEPTPVVVEETSNPGTTAEVTVTEASATVTESPTQSPTPVHLSEEEQEEAAEREALLARRAASEAARQAARQAALDAYYASLTPTPTSTTGGTSAGNAVGTDSTIATGDANATGAVVNTANTNLAGSAGVTGGAGGAQVVSSGNGPSSTNTGTLVLDNDSTTIQDNDANVNTSLTQSATTGSNRNSDNVGGNASTTTGDANVTGTIITAVNTNVAGVMVSEFNVDDNHVGDLVLDFGAGCVSGCGSGPISVANSNNGGSSTNTGTVNETNDNTTVQTNDAIIGSELTLTADSGNNRSNDNIGGETSIETGDANVAGNILTFANTNVAGNVIYAVVNIFGDLVGDIILTEDAINNCCGGTDLSASNTGNGPDSTNTAAIDIENSDTIVQTNDAVIDNNLVLNAQTGNNSANDNVGGDASINTGKVDVNASLLNVVNTNLIGGNMWLILINEAGNWVGKLMGAPEGSTFAASENAGYTIDENGYITVTNSENGPDSNNNAEVNQTNNNTTTQTNTAAVSNSMNLSANTGGNSTNDNIGGNSSIKTGDATIIANLVNFVNTNIVGNGKLVVTVVNVFGSWLGDFVTPGQEKDTTHPTQEVATGGNNNQPNGDNNSKSEDNSSESNATISQKSSSNVSGGTLTGGVKQAVSGFIGSIQGNNSVSVSDNSNVEQKVAGISTPNVKDISSNKKVTVNLAWLVLILPIMGAGYIGRKIFVGTVLTKRIS